MTISSNIKISAKGNLFVGKLFSKAPQIGLSIIFLILICSSGYAADGISWGRFWFQPQLWLYEKYSDNIYLNSENTGEDYITTISPKLSGRFAFTSDSNLELNYNGNFTHHTNFDNFGNYNEGNLKWSLFSPTGSNVSIGAKAIDTFIQPYSEDDDEKPYLVKTAFADTNFKIGSFTEFGMRYGYAAREFDDESDEADNYDRNSFGADFVYRYFTRFPFLLEYRYAINNREYNPSANSRSNAIYVGARWTPETRLTGNLRIGYQYTDYDDIDDVSLIVVDTSLVYRFSDMTNLQLRAIRRLKDSVSVDIRETGNNYIFTILEGHVSYKYSEPLLLSLRLTYEKKDYEREEEREDDLYGTRVGLDYSINRWVAISFAYRYRANMSTLEWAEYRENAVYGGVKFSL